MNFLPFSTFAPDPLSLEEISATQIKIPCKTLLTLKGFGYLDPSLGKADLPAGAELELPLWAAQALIKKRYITARVPNKYRESYRDVLKADPTVVDLNRLGPHFYQTGLHLAALPTHDAVPIAEILPEVFQHRLVRMADSYNFVRLFKSAEEGCSDSSGALMKENHMDCLEKSIFETAKKGAQQMAMYFVKR